MSLLVVTSECMKACNASNELICPSACIEDGILGMLMFLSWCHGNVSHATTTSGLQQPVALTTWLNEQLSLSAPVQEGCVAMLCCSVTLLLTYLHVMLSSQESYPDVWLQLWALLGESSTMAAQLDYNPAVKHTSSLAAIVLRVVEEVIDRDLDRHSSGYGHSSIYTARADLDSAALAAALSGSDVQQLRRAVAGAILQRLDLRPFSQVRDDIAPDDDWSECMLHCEHVSGEACGVCLMAV